jgi:hypothetical protein
MAVSILVSLLPARVAWRQLGRRKRGREGWAASELFAKLAVADDELHEGVAFLQAFTYTAKPANVFQCHAAAVPTLL